MKTSGRDGTPLCALAFCTWMSDWRFATFPKDIDREQRARVTAGLQRLLPVSTPAPNFAPMDAAFCIY
ncbi:hypothetical protein WKW80_28190 [Variovorax humicola]|uniref:Uncharacterized protein n=1 Tax=Variovorax humicola TaxID=1769758 RepID=A0ABU8W7I1_9BURK